MVTAAKIRDGRNYLKKHLTHNDYYCESEHIAGNWLGIGANYLGLPSDEAIHEDSIAFERLRLNKHPVAGTKLTPRNRANRVSMIDCQCSAPKSVSIMSVTLGDQRLLRAHDKAAALAFSEMECFAATQANTRFHRDIRFTGNLVAARFRHTASRALDPQVHSHFAVMNITYDKTSESWRALSEIEMFKAIRYIGKVYQNALASQCLNLGYEIEVVRNDHGVVHGFEIKGVPFGICRRFSKRRQDVESGIDRFINKFGRKPNATETHAIAVSTKGRELIEISTSEVLAQQRGELSQAEWALLDALRLCAEMQIPDIVEPDSTNTARACLVAAAENLYTKNSINFGHDILAEALNANLGCLDLETLKNVAAKSTLVGLHNREWLHENFITVAGAYMEEKSVELVNNTVGACQPLMMAGAINKVPQMPDFIGKVVNSKDRFISLFAASPNKSRVIDQINETLGLLSGALLTCFPDDDRDAFTCSCGPTLTISELLEKAKNGLLKRQPFIVVLDAERLSNTVGYSLLNAALAVDARILFVQGASTKGIARKTDFVCVLEAYSRIARVQANIRHPSPVAEAFHALRAGAFHHAIRHLAANKHFMDGGTDYVHAAVEHYVSRYINKKSVVSYAVVATSANDKSAFTAHLRARLKELDELRDPCVAFTAIPLSWGARQKRMRSNYSHGMLIKLRKRWGLFSKGEFLVVARIDNKSVWVGASGPRPECKFPISKAFFDVLEMKELEICCGERLIVDGSPITVATASKDKIVTVDGKTLHLGMICHIEYDYVAAPNRVYEKSIDDVIVVGTTLNTKAALFACSISSAACNFYIRDKKQLFQQTSPCKCDVDFVNGKDDQPWKPAPRERAWKICSAIGHLLKDTANMKSVSVITFPPKIGDENDDVLSTTTLERGL